MRNRIEQSNFRMIEAELYCYHDTKKELEQFEEDILDSSTYQEVAVQSGTTGDTTANKAVKLISSKAIMEIKRRLGAIEKAIDIVSMEENKVKLLQMKYFDRKYTDIGIMNELHISKRTFFRWREDIIKLIGEFLGWRI